MSPIKDTLKVGKILIFEYMGGIVYRSIDKSDSINWIEESIVDFGIIVTDNCRLDAVALKIIKIGKYKFLNQFVNHFPYPNKT